MGWTICFFIILLIIFFYITNKPDQIEDDDCKEYSIVKNKKYKNIDDKFNLKEFDTINENIIIHNKFKNELVDYNTIKHIKNNEHKINKMLEIEKINNEINKNAKILKLRELDKIDKKIRQENKFIKNHIKQEFNDLITDYKQQRATRDDIIIMIKNIDNEIKNTLKYINNIQNNNKDIFVDDYFLKAPLEKINLLNKKREYTLNLFFKFRYNKFTL